MPMATHQPMTVARIKRIASPLGPKSSPRWASPWSRSATMLAPSVATAGEVHRDSDQDSGKGDDRKQGQGLGRGERLQLLHPSERRSPDQSVKTHTSIGDEPNAVADSEEHGPERGRLPAGSCQLAGHGPNGKEHGSSGHQGQGEVDRGTDADSDTRWQSRERR